MGRVRVLVVEDSLTIRKHIVDVLSGLPEFVVVGEASDGRRAIELCQELRPDVVTMDIVLPTMSGVAATRYIMSHCPTPILVVSASFNRGELFSTYDALAAGAVDVLDKPLGVERELVWERRLASAVRVASRVRVITRLRMPSSEPRITPSDSVVPKSASRAPRLVAIGASTGGPAAVRTILSSLPKSFPLPILLVVHMNEPFGQAFAEWLDTESAVRVRSVTDGEALPSYGKGGVLIAPPDRHLAIEHNRLVLDAGPERHSCRPSVDVLFESVAKYWGGRAIACLLTGMGRDGALGLLAVKHKGGVTIAQDEATSVVFGMPGEAVKLGAADRVLPITQIAQELVELAEHFAAGESCHE